MHATDFRLKVLRESSAVVKRGYRDTQPGRRIDYLSSQELAVHSRQFAKKYRQEKAMYWVMKARLN